MLDLVDRTGRRGRGGWRARVTAGDEEKKEDGACEGQLRRSGRQGIHSRARRGFPRRWPVPPRIERHSIQHKPLGRGVAATGREGGVSLGYPMAKNLTDTEIDEVLEVGKWACEELNLGPHAYQA